MLDQQLFEIAAKLLNLRPDQLRLKRRYLDVIVIELLDGAKYTYFVADLEAMAAGDREVDARLTEEAQAATGDTVEPRAVKPSHTRKR